MALCTGFGLCAQNLQRIGQLSYGQLSLSGCWHHVDQNGGEWALVGTSVGLSIVDVSDPTQPVQKFTVPGLTNNWREVRTWAGYAYVCSEAMLSGVTIVNLNYLPDSIQWKVWRGDGFFEDRVKKNHTVQAADGHLYLFGGSDISNGALISDLNDPWNPHILSKYAAHYVHDGFVRGDTLWTSEGSASRFGVVDISDKTNPVLLTTYPTPGGYSHNGELSNDGQTFYTTDEVQSAPLASFDVSDLEDIRMLDVYKPSKKPQGEVHNVRVMPGDFLVCPSYQGQLTLVDGSRPANLIEIAWDSLGNGLVWDADPYLPSGIVLVTLKQGEFFVYQQPAYTHAAWLEGRVTDASTGLPLVDAEVSVQNTPNRGVSVANGEYKTGAGTSGTYTIRVERIGYVPQTIQSLPLESGVVVSQDFALVPIGLAVKNIDNELLVRVSPVPFEDFLQVEFPEPSPFQHRSTTLRLSDISGKTLLEKRGVSMLEGLKNLPSGPYLLHILTENGGLQTIQVLKK